jgi:type VI secretion system secreted protein VgrG
VALLRPRLWFLTRTNDCKIFQNKSVPDIISDVLGEFGITDVRK